MRQTPLAEIDDELVDYMIIPRLTLLRVVREIPRLFNGTLCECPYVYCGKCRQLQIVPLDAASEDLVEVDGELEGVLPLSVEYTEQKINVISGKNA